MLFDPTLWIAVDETGGMPRPEVPQFGALLRSHIASVPDVGRPAFLAGLERSAADRYRRWADDLPQHREALLGCAKREDEIADLISASYPVDDDVRARIDASLPDAIALYYDVFEPYSPLDQLFLQSEAELQGALAWVGMAAGTDDPQMIEILARCTALERESSAVVKELLDAVPA